MKAENEINEKGITMIITFLKGHNTQKKNCYKKELGRIISAYLIGLRSVGRGWNSNWPLHLAADTLIPINCITPITNVN